MALQKELNKNPQQAVCKKIMVFLELCKTLAF